MTQHILEEDTQADKKALRDLAILVGLFAGVTVVLALGVVMFLD